MKEKLYNRNLQNVDKNFILEYYKIEKTSNDKIEESSVTYGVEIIKKNYKNNEISDISYANDITNSEDEIINLLKLLSKNNVTPISLEYILEDMYKYC